MAKKKFNPSEMPEVKTSQVDTEDKSEVFDSANEKTNSKYLYDVKNGKKVSKKDAYKPNGEIKEQYKSFVTDTVAGKKLGSGDTAKKVVEEVKDTIKNGQERNAIRADYVNASPDVKKSLDANGGKGTKAAQKVIDEQVESVKNGEGFEGSKKILTDTEEGKAFTSGEEITDEDKETNFKQVEEITSEPVVEQAAADMGLDMDNPPEDPKLAQEVGESALKKSGLPDDLVSKLVNAFVPSKDGSKKDVKSELADALKDKQEQLNELSKTGMGDKICGILTVLSAIATLATGGVIPPVNFITVKDIITDPRGYLQQNRKFNIEEKQKDISSANETIRSVEQKDINYKADQEQIKQILADHPDWTEEQATDFYYNKIKRNAELSQEQATKDVELAREFVNKAFTSPDEALRQATEYRNQAVQYRNAIKELDSADVNKQVELMTQLVPTLGALATSFSSAGSSSGKSINGSVGTGELTKFIANADISGGLSFSNNASSGTNSMSREGVAKSQELYRQYLESTKDSKEQLKKALEDAANKCDAIANQFEEQAKTTSKNFDSNKYKSNVNSDTRKKHVYISKEDREAIKNSINNKKYQYIPKEKR